MKIRDGPSFCSRRKMSKEKNIQTRTMTGPGNKHTITTSPSPSYFPPFHQKYLQIQHPNKRKPKLTSINLSIHLSIPPSLLKQTLFLRTSITSALCIYSHKPLHQRHIQHKHIFPSKKSRKPHKQSNV
jgi:hypothetical protein